MFIPNGLENILEIWSPEMRGCRETSEHTATDHLLKVLLTQVLHGEEK